MSEVRFGSFRVVETLGSGGLSTIYKAIQEPLGRTVAVKALKAQMAPTSSFGEQLDREARILSGLAHPNIVLLLDHARAPSGRPYLVLEHVEGMSVAQLLQKRKRLSPESALAIASAMCAALEHVHGQGVVHRDVKPSNVLVSRTGAVKLIDFGIAQRERQRQPSVDELAEGVTPSGRVGVEAIKDAFGTPAYMSPEQILGDFVDGRSDLYSLGVCLYEMTSGTKPFEASTERTSEKRKAAPARDTLPPLGKSARPPPVVRTASSRPPPVRVASKPAPQRIRRDVVPLRERAPDVPRVLERIVMRLLEKNPTDRYENASAVRERLDAALRSLTHEEPRAILQAELEDTKRTAAAAERVRPRSPIAPAWRAIAGHAILLGMFGATVIALEGGSCSRPASRGSDTLEPTALPPKTSGGLRVVASPWAHVRVDGIDVETTPFARAIPLAPGKHWVTLTHPDAPPVDREVDVETGNVVTLDVTMAIDERDAGKDAR